MGVQSKQSNAELAFNFCTEECHVFAVMTKLIISVELNMCGYYFQWRLTWQRGVCLISDLGGCHVKKALSHRIRYLSLLTLTQLVSLNTLGSNIKLSVLSSPVLRIQIIAQLAVWYHDWLKYFCLLSHNRCFIILFDSLSVLVVYLIFFCRRRDTFASSRDKMVELWWNIKVEKTSHVTDQMYSTGYIVFMRNISTISLINTR